MGNSQGVGLVEYYNKYTTEKFTPQFIQNLRDELGVVGGGEGFISGGSSCIGGYDALQDYGNSLFSRAKEKLIRDIASEVFSALRISGAKNAKTAPISDVVSHLRKLVPNPSTGKRFKESFNSSSSKQKEMCHALANAINSNYGGRIINMESSDSEMCNQVAEVMYSLLTGLHTEFLNVAGDVTRIMKNMQTVEGALTAAYKKQVELVEASGDSRLKSQSSESAKLYNEIKAEYDRQSAILANLMNVSIGPAGKSIISSLEDNRDFAGLVRDLKAETGTTAFGDKLGHLLSGISTVAHSAELVDKALRKIGMSVADFKSAKHAGDLRVKVLNTIMKDSPNSKALDEMMAAAQIIYNNNYDHDAISKLLTGKKGGDEEVDGGDDDDIMGGDEVLPTYWQKKSLSKKIENKGKYRDLVLTDFRKLLKSHYQRVVDAASPLAGKVGKSIPVSDALDYFVKVFHELPSLDKDKIHIALSGYAKDSTSRERREQFMNSYLLMNQAIEPLVKGPEGNLFKNLQSAVNAMVKSIDEFSEKMVKAITEIHVDNPEEIQSELKRSANLFYGSGDSGDDLFGSGSWVAFDKVKNEMKYFYSIANIKTNMSRFADDLKSYSSDYEQLLGEESGWLINTIKKEFLELINFTDPTVTWANIPDPKPSTTSRAKVVQEALNDYHTANNAGTPDEKNRAVVAHKNLVKLWTAQMNAKEGMVKVAQAVDLYLKSFTDGIARHPDAVGSIIKLLEQVDIVARWFNEKSGDNLSYLFETFPESVEIKGGVPHSVPKYSYDAANAIVDADGNIKLPASEHYYNYTEDRCNKQSLPGNPFLGRPLGQTTQKQFDGIMNLTEKTIKGMRALENILSAFKSIGSKFGDLDPQANTFMNPGQMFNGLMEYIKMSTFTSCFAAEAKADTGAAAINSGNPITAALYHSRTEVKEVTTEVGSRAQAIPMINQAQHRPAGGGRDVGLHWSQHIAANRLLNLRGVAMNRATDDRDKHGVLTGVHDKRELGVAPATADRYRVQALAMSAIPYDSDEKAGSFWDYHDYSKRGVHLDAAGWVDFFHDTDLLFQMTIKSIAAKIFTVVDAYRLFNRPTIRREQSYSLNPLRTIIGGGTSAVKIVPEAAELYLRLPLLAEWYREMFAFNNDKTPGTLDEWKLSIVPAIDGTWSEFVGIIFDKAGEVKEGNYTESQSRVMIIAINEIYKTYKTKYPKATTRNIINSFVLEMNRIFGFVKQREMNDYIDQRRAFLRDSPEGINEDFLDYDILNANDQFGSRPAPSDKFINVGLKSTSLNKASVQMLQKKVTELRLRMDAEFNAALVDNTNANETFKVSFGETLKNYKKELSSAKSEADQYQIVLQLIQGANKSVDMSADKLIMVHETVATPLALLYGVYRVLSKYNSLVHGASVVNLANWNSTRAAGGGAHIRLNNNEDVRTEYKTYLTNKYSKLITASKDAVLDAMIVAFTGTDGVAGLTLNNCGYFRSGAPIPNTFDNTNIDAPHLLQDLLNALADLSLNSSKLVTCSVGAGGNVNVDFSPLQDLCANLLSQVKSNIQKLRTSFPPSVKIVTRYEEGKHVGSVHWLEENLMEVLFNDRDECGLNTGYSSHLIQTMQCLATPGVGGRLTLQSGFTTVDNALRGLIYYEHLRGRESLPATAVLCNPTRFPWNVIPMKKTADSTPEKDAMTQSSADATVAAAATAATAGAATVNAIFGAPIVYFETKDTINNFNIANMYAAGENLEYNSLLTRFNKLVHMYLFTNFEDGALKIYTPLFESFMNGAASREVLQGKAFPNVGEMNAAGDSADPVQNCTTAGGGAALRAPPEGTVLYASTASAMRALATSVAVLGSVQKKKHAYDNVAEIPEFLKERMRNNLPYFSKLFQEINERADFLKRILTYTNIKNNITSCVAASANNSDARSKISGESLVDMCPGGAALTSARNTDYLSGLLTRFIELSGSIKKCCDSVYKELNDKPVPFLETSKDFIADYKRKNGVLPLMPVSSLLAPLAALNRSPNLDDTVDTSHLLLPVVTNGSSAYKFNNAAKLLLSDLNADPNIDHFPGAKDIYNMYAEAADGNVLTSAEYSNTVKLAVKLAKFLNTGVVNARMFGRPLRGSLNTARVHNCGSVFGTRWEARHMTDTTVGAPVADNNFSILPLALTSLTAVIEVTENSNIKYAKERLAKIVSNNLGSVYNDTRKQLRIFNILDMNIVPINVHALMREIPFVNILNYAYTFDRMVHDFVLPDYVRNLSNSIKVDNIMIKANADITNPRELLVKLLVHPYADLGTDKPEYFGLLASLFNGNDDMKLGRPRYLSDQLWHKALLTSSVQLGYGNSLTNTSTPVIANTNLGLGPAGYEAQRAVVKLEKNNVTFSSGIINSMLDELFKAFSITGGLGFGGVNMRNVIRAIKDMAVLSTGGSAVNDTDVEAISRANNLNAARLALNTALMIFKTSGATDDVKSFIAKWVDKALLEQFQVSEIAFAISGIYSTVHDQVAEGKVAAARVAQARFVTAATAAYNIADASGAADQAAALTEAKTSGDLGTAASAFAAAVRAASQDDVDDFAMLYAAEATVGTGPFTAVNAPLAAAIYQAIVDPTGNGAGQVQAAAIVANGHGGRAAVVGKTPDIVLTACDAKFAAAGVSPNNDLLLFMAYKLTPNSRATLTDNALADQALYDAADAALTLYQNAYNARYGAAPVAIIPPLPVPAPVGPLAGGTSKQKQDDDAAATAAGAAGAPPVNRPTLPEETAAQAMIAAGGLLPAVTPASILTKLNMDIRAMPFPNTPNFGAYAVSIIPAMPVAQFSLDIKKTKKSPMAVAGAAAAGPGVVITRLSAEVSQSVDILIKLFDWLDNQNEYPKVPLYLKRLVLAGCSLKQNTTNYTDLQTRVHINTFTASNDITNAGAYRLDIGIEDLFADQIIKSTMAALGGADQTRDMYTIIRALDAWGSGIARSLYVIPYQIAKDFNGLLPKKLVERASLELVGDPVAAVGLKIRKNDRWEVANIGGKNMDVGNVVYCAELGRARFDTKLVRNLTWLVQIQRIMRVVLINHLSWLNTPVVRGLKITDSKITEYDGNEVQDDADYDGSKYSIM